MASHRPRSVRRVLARVPMTERLLEELHERGRLHVTLSREAAVSSATSLDGSGATVWLGASGRPVQLRLDDLVDPEDDREVHFPTLTLAVRWRDEELLVCALAGAGIVDPWFDRAPPAPRLAKSG